MSFVSLYLYVPDEGSLFSHICVSAICILTQRAYLHIYIYVHTV